MDPTYIPEGNYYTVREIAEMYGVTKRAVHKWIIKGWIKTIYFGGVHHIEEKQLERLNRTRII